MLKDVATLAVVTKARAVYGKRLTVGDYKELLNKQTVNDIAAYLKSNTHYAKALEGINESSVHRGQLENLLKQDLFNIYARLVHFEPLDAKGFYAYLLTRLEMEQILNRIMYLNAKSVNEFIVNLPSFMITHASFDLLALGKIKNFEELLDVIAGTPYREALQSFAPDEDGVVDFTKCEVALFTTYYQSLIQTIEKQFSGKARDELLTAIKHRIDLANIVSIFRMKIYFKASADQIRELLLPFHGGALTARILDELLAAQDSAELLANLQGTSFGRELQEANPTYIESTIHQYIHHQFKAGFRQSTNAALSLYYLVSLFDIELENIVHIIEGVRYKVPRGDIEKLLIL